MCSLQSSLLFLYYVVFSVMLVQYCLCVSSIQCTQYSVLVYSVGSVIYHSMQVVFRVASVQFKHSVYRVESVAYSQWCSVLAGLQSTVFMVCLLYFSVGSVQSSIQFERYRL